MRLEWRVVTIWMEGMVTKRKSRYWRWWWLVKSVYHQPECCCVLQSEEDTDWETLRKKQGTVVEGERERERAQLGRSLTHSLTLCVHLVLLDVRCFSWHASIVFSRWLIPMSFNYNIMVTTRCLETITNISGRSSNFSKSTSNVLACIHLLTHWSRNKYTYSHALI